MKKLIVVAGAVCLVILAGGLSSAYGQARTETSAQSGNWTLTLGADLWLHQWQSGTVVSGSQTGSNIQTFTASTAAVVPTLSLSYSRDFFISGSYFFAPEYDFGKNTDIVSVDGPGGASSLLEAETKADRQEAEVTVGWWFHPNFAIAAGYKGVFQEYKTTTRSIAGVALEPERFSSETNFHGVTLGVIGRAAIGETGLAIFANAAGGYLFVDCSPSCPNFEDATYAAAKLAVAYQLANLPLLFTLGYRVQVINTPVKNADSNAIDLTHGLVVGVNYSFTW